MAALDMKRDDSTPQREKDAHSPLVSSPAEAARSRSRSNSRSRRSSHHHRRSSRHSHASAREDRHRTSSRRHRHHESSSSRRRSRSRSPTRRRRSSSRDRRHASHRRHDHRDHHSRDDSRRHRKHSDGDDRRHRKRSRSASASRTVNGAVSAAVKRTKEDIASSDAAMPSLVPTAMLSRQLPLEPPVVAAAEASVVSASVVASRSESLTNTAVAASRSESLTNTAVAALSTAAIETRVDAPVVDPLQATTPTEADKNNNSCSQSSTTKHVDAVAVATAAKRLIDDAKAALAASQTAKQTAPAPTLLTPVEREVPVAPAVDVRTIKQEILKALAEARSTIAEIKCDNTGTTTVSVPVATLPIETDTNTQAMQSPKPAPSSQPPPAAPAAVDEFDMFSMAELDDDAALPTSPRVAARAIGGQVGTTDVSTLPSNCDDAEGYYTATVGEVLDNTYRVLGVVGKGVFSTVVRCARIASRPECGNSGTDSVAIKLIRNNDVMRDAAQLEIRLLRELAARDPREKKHCVKLLDTFEHRNHVALVFEPMQMNVREAMKKFGGRGGIAINAVRVFAKHLLIALQHLEACAIVHADIKPDNILLDAAQTTIKLCDFGSAFKTDVGGTHDPTPYLVSRFYRAPEIVLGLAYDRAVDMWSVGCCLFEMFTGQVLFPGSTNNEMLKRFMALKGKVPTKLIKRHRQVYVETLAMEPHFTDDLKFCSRETDCVTGKPILRLMDTVKATNELTSSLLAAKSSTDDRKLVLELRSLLDRMLTLDPTKRISVRDALAHPFVKSG